MSSYEKLTVYQNSYKLAYRVHQFSLILPRYLQYDISDQIRRASRSIPSNIAEGYSRGVSAADTRRFVLMALGSNTEVLFNLQFLRDCRLIREDLFSELYTAYTINGKQLKQLSRSLAN